MIKKTHYIHYKSIIHKLFQAVIEESEWGGRLEFLMACIATSVGLGNVWRFPFTAYENGGGAFLIPYIIILILVGKPFYLLEGLLGQFTSRSCVKTWYMTPAMKGEMICFIQVK